MILCEMFQSTQRCAVGQFPRTEESGRETSSDLMAVMYVKNGNQHVFSLNVVTPMQLYISKKPVN